MEVQQAPAPRSLAPLQPPQPRGTKRRADTTPNESRAPKRQLRSTAVQKANRHQPSLQPEGRYQVNADELEPVSAELDPLVATDRMDTRVSSHFIMNSMSTYSFRATAGVCNQHRRIVKGHCQVSRLGGGVGNYGRMVAS